MPELYGVIIWDGRPIKRFVGVQHATGSLPNVVGVPRYPTGSKEPFEFPVLKEEPFSESNFMDTRLGFLRVAPTRSMGNHILDRLLDNGPSESDSSSSILNSQRSRLPLFAGSSPRLIELDEGALGSMAERTPWMPSVFPMTYPGHHHGMAVLLYHRLHPPIPHRPTKSQVIAAPASETIVLRRTDSRHPGDTARRRTESSNRVVRPAVPESERSAPRHERYRALCRAWHTPPRGAARARSFRATPQTRGFRDRDTARSIIVAGRARLIALKPPSREAFGLSAWVPKNLRGRSECPLVLLCRSRHNDTLVRLPVMAHRKLHRPCGLAWGRGNILRTDAVGVAGTPRHEQDEEEPDYGHAASLASSAGSFSHKTTIQL